LDLDFKRKSLEPTIVRESATKFTDFRRSIDSQVFRTGSLSTEKATPSEVPQESLYKSQSEPEFERRESFISRVRRSSIFDYAQYKRNFFKGRFFWGVVSIVFAFLVFFFYTYSTHTPHPNDLSLYSNSNSKRSYDLIADQDGFREIARREFESIKEELEFFKKDMPVEHFRSQVIQKHGEYVWIYILEIQAEEQEVELLLIPSEDGHFQNWRRRF